jgi:hypothetical protein
VLSIFTKHGKYFKIRTAFQRHSISNDAMLAQLVKLKLFDMYRPRQLYYGPFFACPKKNMKISSEVFEGFGELFSKSSPIASP